MKKNDALVTPARVTSPVAQIAAPPAPTPVNPQTGIPVGANPFSLGGTGTIGAPPPVPELPVGLQKGPVGVDPLAGDKIAEHPGDMITFISQNQIDDYNTANPNHFNIEPWIVGAGRIGFAAAQAPLETIFGTAPRMVGGLLSGNLSPQDAATGFARGTTIANMVIDAFNGSGRGANAFTQDTAAPNTQEALKQMQTDPAYAQYFEPGNEKELFTQANQYVTDSIR